MELNRVYAADLTARLPEVVLTDSSIIGLHGRRLVPTLVLDTTRCQERTFITLGLRAGAWSTFGVNQRLAIMKHGKIRFELATHVIPGTKVLAFDQGTAFVDEVITRHDEVLAEPIEYVAIQTRLGNYVSGAFICRD